MKKCKYCNGTIGKNSKVCPFCIGKQPSDKKMIFLCVGLFCLLGIFVMPFAGEKTFDKVVGTLFYFLGTIVSLSWPIYNIWYFKCKKFNNTKKKINDYVKECNDLNSYIEELKSSTVKFNKTDYGNVSFYNNSNYNYKRLEFQNFKNSQFVCNCSASVCNNAKNKPFEYLCKYFNIEISEKTLEMLEEVLNNYLSVEQGKKFLNDKREKILKSIENEIPFLIKKFDYDNVVV